MEKFNFIKKIIPGLDKQKKADLTPENRELLKAYFKGEENLYDITRSIKNMLDDPEIYKLAKEAFKKEVAEIVTLLTEPQEMREMKAKENPNYIKAHFEKAKEISGTFDQKKDGYNEKHNFFTKDPQLVTMTETAILLSLQNFLIRKDYNELYAPVGDYTIPKEIVASPKIQRAAKEAVISVFKNKGNLKVAWNIGRQFRLPENTIASPDFQEALKTRIKEEKDYMESLNIDEWHAYDDPRDMTHMLRTLGEYKGNWIR